MHRRYLIDGKFRDLIFFDMIKPEYEKLRRTGGEL